MAGLFTIMAWFHCRQSTSGADIRKTRSSKNGAYLNFIGQLRDFDALGLAQGHRSGEVYWNGSLRCALFPVYLSRSMPCDSDRAFGSEQIQATYLTFPPVRLRRLPFANVSNA